MITTIEKRIGQEEDLVCITMGSPWHIDLYDEAITIRCVDGEIWATGEGDAEDHLLGPGGIVELAGDGTVVVEALTPFACIRVEGRHAI